MQRCKTAKKNASYEPCLLYQKHALPARDICIMRMECVSSSFLSHLWREDRLVVCTSSPRVSHHRFLLSSTAKYNLARQGSSHISHTVSTPICVVVCMREYWKWINFWELLHWYRTCNRVCRPPTQKLNQVSNIDASRFNPANSDAHRNMKTRKHRQ